MRRLDVERGTSGAVSVDVGRNLGDEPRIDELMTWWMT